MENIVDVEKVKIKFEGQTHQIDIKTLTSSLLIFSEALKEINTELKTGKNIEIKIEALKPGSFEIHTIVSAVNENDLLSAISTLGGVASVGFLGIGAITKTYAGIVKLRFWLKGEDKIQSAEQIEDKTTIKTTNGNTYVCSNVVYNIYHNNQAVNDAISDQFRILEEDSAIEGFELTLKDEFFSVPKDNFSVLAERVDVPGENKKKEIKSSQTVHVVKPVLEKSTTRRWEFVWSGNKISANISDAEFLESMVRGEYRFGTGDKMVVDLQINQTLNPLYDVWMNESYQIILVREHVPRAKSPETSKLFDLPEDI